MTQNLFYDLPNDLIEEIQTKAYKMVHKEFVGNLSATIRDETINFYIRISNKYWVKYIDTIEFIDIKKKHPEIRIIMNEKERSLEELTEAKKYDYNKFDEYNSFKEKLCYEHLVEKGWYDDD